ncbi:S-layer homology domain-containing protein [Heliomicrobium modesticaldum]|uniref:S-layer homology domain-containing protein n=1 Tax=Heliomicrobium modesticaldum TaxID=35701 RepID=UPI00164EF105|nr:S-layer homology domain-containing protein [Heliomicrobium modesticaldum]
MRRRLISACVALSIVLSPTAGLAAVRQFGDVSTVMPEYRPIMKLSAQGTIKGRGDGNFGPSDPVKQLEALVMVQRFFGMEATATAAASRLTPDMEKKFGGNVPAWGKGYLVTAVNQNLLDANEYFPWHQGATRAWVARLLVRLLNKEQEAQSRMNAPLTFADATLIPASLRGHIAVATDLGLIRGRENGCFDPNSIVTRGEMAIFLDRAERKMDRLPPGIDEATFISGRDAILSVLDEENRLSSLTLDANARIFGTERAVALSDLNPQDKIRYIQDGDKVVYLEVVQGSGQKANVLRGEVIASLPEQGLLTLKDDAGKPFTYSLATSVSVIDLAGQMLSTSHVGPGSKAQLRLNNEGKIAEILLESVGQQGLYGTIVDINLTAKLLILSDGANHYSSYYLADNTTVEYNGKRFASLEDLAKGDLVSVEVDGSYVVNKIILQKPKSTVTVKGTVSLISRDSRLVTIKGDDGQLYAFELPETTALQFSDGTSAAIENLYLQDTVTLQLENGTVKKLVIVRAGNTKGLTGKIASIDANRRLLIVKDARDRLQSYEINDPVILDIEGNTKPTISNLGIDTSIEFELNADNKITYIKSKNTIEGVVTRVDADRHLITLRDAAGTEKIYTVETNAECQIFRRSGEDLDDIDVDDRVKVRVSGDKINRIQVHTQLTGEIIDKTSERIYIKDIDNNERSYTVNSTLKLIVPNIIKPSLSDVTIRQWAVVSYWGDEPYQIAVQTPVAGEVTGVDTGRDKLVIRQYDGSSRTLEKASPFKVDKGGTTSYGLSAISIGDRIQAFTDEQNRIMRAFVASKVSGKIDGINRTTKDIYIGTTVGYHIDSNTIITLNGVRKNFDDIQQKQSATIYYTGGYNAIEVNLSN